MSESSNVNNLKNALIKGSKIHFQHLTAEDLRAPMVEGWTVGYWLVSQGFLPQIPEELVTRDFLRMSESHSEQTILHLIAEKHPHQLVHLPASSLDDDLISRWDRWGKPAAHYAAQWGYLSIFPGKPVTDLMLRIVDRERNSVAHIAAACQGNSESVSRSIIPNKTLQIPQSLMSAELLRLRNSAGRTVAHNLAASKRLHLVPRSLLTADLLREAAESNRTVLHEAAENNEVCLLPKELLAPELMLMKDSWGESVLETLCKKEVDTVREKTLSRRMKNRLGRLTALQMRQVASRAVQELLEGNDIPFRVQRICDDLKI